MPFDFPATFFVGDGKPQYLGSDVFVGIVGREFIFNDVQLWIGRKGEIKQVAIRNGYDAIANLLFGIHVNGLFTKDGGGVVYYFSFKFIFPIVFEVVIILVAFDEFFY